jgi:DNA-binding response OmpR family regulator
MPDNELVPAKAATPRGRVLLIEDNDDSRAMMADILRTHGYEVAEAGDGGSGIAEARTMKPDVALIDIGLPDQNGHAVASALRAERSADELLLIALTGYGPDDTKKASDAGFDLLFTKPVDLKRLLDRIAEATGKLAPRAGG